VHCNPDPLWVTALRPTSNALLVLNASACSVLYCLTSKHFHAEVRTHYDWFKEKVRLEMLIAKGLGQKRFPFGRVSHAKGKWNESFHCLLSSSRRGILRRTRRRRARCR